MSPETPGLQVRELMDLLSEFVDDEECWFDHHGYCQNHGLSGGHGQECRNSRARMILGLEQV